MVVQETELPYLRRCVELAAEALDAGEEPFGSVLVGGDGTVLGEDHNRVASGDRTRHPEFELARWSAAHLTPGAAGGGPQICHRLDASWLPFHALCRRHDPRVPATLAGALAPVNIVHADARALPPGRYELGSMHFVAESVTEDFAEFAGFCRAFVRAVAPGGYLVAAFMENMPTYRIGPASHWPGCPVDPATITEVFTPLTRDLDITHIDTDPTLPDYGDSGMVLLTGVADAV